MGIYGFYLGDLLLSGVLRCIRGAEAGQPGGLSSPVNPNYTTSVKAGDGLWWASPSECADAE